MHLTQYADYSLRVLMLLASRDDKLTIAEIARTFGISHDHLRKVVHHLAGCGYLSTVRGKNGGLRLAMPAKAINVGAVVRELEPDFDLVECFAPEHSHCTLIPECALKRVLHEATDSFLAVLDNYTLADLVGRASLSQTLGALPARGAKGPRQRRVASD